MLHLESYTPVRLRTARSTSHKVISPKSLSIVILLLFLPRIHDRQSLGTQRIELLRKRIIRSILPVRAQTPSSAIKYSSIVSIARRNRKTHLIAILRVNTEGITLRPGKMHLILTNRITTASLRPLSHKILHRHTHLAHKLTLHSPTLKSIIRARRQHHHRHKSSNTTKRFCHHHPLHH